MKETGMNRGIIRNVMVLGFGFNGKLEEGEIVLCPSRDCSERDDVIRLKGDGRIFIHGRLAETDGEVVAMMRAFLEAMMVGTVEKKLEGDGQ